VLITVRARSFLVALTAALAVVAAAPPARADRPSGAELDRRIAAAARQLEVVVEQYDDSRDELRTTQARARTLGAQLAPMTRDLAERQQVIDGLIARTYQHTRSGPTIALFA
jgi:ABC-type sugar transport system substrate-binding protein